MKILHVVSISFSLKYFIGNQFDYFKNKGVDYYVACSESQDLQDYSIEKEFKTFPVKISRSITPLQDINSILKLSNFIRKENFDIVISHTPKGGLVGVLASYIARTKNRVYFRHGLVFETSYGFKKHLLIFIEKIVGKFSTKIVNVSKSIESEAVRYNLNDNLKNIILGNGSCNGVDINKFSPRLQPKSPDELIVFGFVGRLSKDKGIVELIKSWEILSRKFLNIELWLIGPFDERDVLDSNIKKQINEKQNIKYYGEISNVNLLYKDMDVFVLPSYREGFPTVVLEASASGLPIITTRSTGCIDSIIEGETGLFCDINVYDLFEKMKFYIENIEIRKLHGMNGRKWIESSFSEEFVYKEIQNKILSI